MEPMKAAFDVLGEEAGKGNEKALQALKKCLGLRSLIFRLLPRTRSVSLPRLETRRVAFVSASMAFYWQAHSSVVDGPSASGRVREAQCEYFGLILSEGGRLSAHRAGILFVSP